MNPVLGVLQHALARPSCAMRWRVAADAAEAEGWPTAGVLRAVAAMADLGDDYCVVVERYMDRVELWRKAKASHVDPSFGTRSRFLFDLSELCPDADALATLEASAYPSEFGPKRFSVEEHLLGDRVTFVSWPAEEVESCSVRVMTWTPPHVLRLRRFVLSAACAPLINVSFRLNGTNEYSPEIPGTRFLTDAPDQGLPGILPSSLLGPSGQVVFEIQNPTAEAVLVEGGFVVQW